LSDNGGGKQNLSMSIDRARWNRARRDGALALAILVGLASVFALSRWMDAHRPPVDAVIEEGKLYVTGQTARRMSLGFNGLIADWYWMRSLQYVGLKILSKPERIQLDDLGSLDLRLLAPLLDTATTVDPGFLEPYQYAAVVLPAVDVQEAIRITQKGIADNPSAWKLYHHLGYIYWQERDYQAASQTYGQGAAIPGAPPWMEAMKARMAVEGGSRSTAREIYLRMYEQAGDDEVKDMARHRLMQLDSLDERDAIRKVLSAYSSKFGRCPQSWREIDGVLKALRFRFDASGAPSDPSGTSYRLVNEGCEVDLDPKSEVPYR
jgi:tetratricopeptide (TPR) repeat protein